MDLESALFAFALSSLDLPWLIIVIIIHHGLLYIYIAYKRRACVVVV